MTNLTSKSQWVLLQSNDLDQINVIADSIHPGLPESPEVFSEKYKLFPLGCLKFLFDSQIAGYGIAHPWVLMDIPPLDALMYQLPVSPDCMYVHDVAILTHARGEKGAARFIEHISKIASEFKFQALACVSVYGTDHMWARYGFKIHSSDYLDQKIKTYGDTAKYMVARI